MPNDDIRSFSRMCDVLAWLDSRLTEAAWPPHEVSNVKPTIINDDTVGVPAGLETVEVVMGAVEPGQETMRWARVSPAGRDEVFPVEVDIRTSVQGRTRGQARERWRVLSEVAQGIFYDPSTYTVTTAGEADWSVELGGVTSVAVELIPTDEGWWAWGLVVASATCRI